jgi:cytochrome bd-type quinol oxidase subunit 2
MLASDMLLISDGRNTVVSGTYPIPYSIFLTLKLFDSERRFFTASALIFLEVNLCVFLIYLLLENPESTGLTAFSIGFPCMLIWLKFLVQKNVVIKKSDIKIVGVAPIRVWIEHILLCLALGLSALWANKMQNFDLLGSTFYTLIVYLSLGSAIWPFINFSIYRRRSRDV